MFVFEDSLLTGVDEIDSQHRAIFEMVNEYDYAVQHDIGYKAVRGMLDFLSHYVVDHFADEEKLMVQIKYEKYEEHRKQHTDFTAQLGAYLAESVELDKDLLNRITQTVINWLNIHIKSEDKDLAVKYTSMH